MTDDNYNDLAPAGDSDSSMRNDSNNDNGDSDLFKYMFLYWLFSSDKKKAERDIRGCFKSYVWLIIIMALLMVATSIIKSLTQP